jgi:hypothetical protein
VQVVSKGCCAGAGCGSCAAGCKPAACGKGTSCSSASGCKTGAGCGACAAGCKSACSACKRGCAVVQKCGTAGVCAKGGGCEASDKPGCSVAGKSCSKCDKCTAASSNTGSTLPKYTPGLHSIHIVMSANPAIATDGHVDFAGAEEPGQSSNTNNCATYTHGICTLVLMLLRYLPRPLFPCPERTSHHRSPDVTTKSASHFSRPPPLPAQPHRTIVHHFT